jgi:putative selenate reductase
MTTLAPLLFPDLVRRMRAEAARAGAIFDLPKKKWFTPDARHDFSAVHFGRRAATPAGPAAGPHTQLAQNLVLAWLAGSRILELKTVQVNDRLEISRPCIHAPNVGFNVEWSQELTVPESLREYAKAAYLIEILKATGGFGLLGEPESAGGGACGAFDTVFDISVGYDLDGIRSEKVTGFLRAMRDPRPLYDALRGELRAESDLREFAGLQPPVPLSDCVTLSTFHGCPADQIEAICRYLLNEVGVHVLIKLNPTLLGYDAVRELLHERLGYRHLDLVRKAFDDDLRYDDGLAILRRLRAVAEARGSMIGAKFTNTLVVANRRDLFPTQADPYMYLSGRPLHVLSMTLMQRFRDEVGFEMPVSFSAGVDAGNFPAAVACGMVPVTTCTDLLRNGGYGRLPAYLKALGTAMDGVGTTTREAYVLAARGHGAEAVEAACAGAAGGDALWAREGERLAGLAGERPDELPAALRAAATAAGLDGDALVLAATRVAGRLNGREVVPALADDPRYAAAANAKPPRRIDSRLALYDCINCDLCISACPNDAVFVYQARPVRTATEVLTDADGGGLARAPGRGFAIADAHQIAVYEGACNDCSNCEVYCPEEGAPFRVKERLFPGADAFAAGGAVGLDGFYRDGETLHGRVDGRELSLAFDRGTNRATVAGDGLQLELSWEPLAVVGGRLLDGAEAFDTAALWRMKTVWESIYGSPAPNPLHPDPPPPPLGADPSETTGPPDSGAAPG